MQFWYDKQGKPIEGTDAEVGTEKWLETNKKVEEMLQDKSYKIIEQTVTPGGKYWVSTVWLGLDHSFMWFSDKPNPHPVIFETMVFDTKRTSWYKYEGKRRYYRKDREQVRYVTEDEAKAGHAKMVKRYTKLEKGKK